MRVLDLDFLVVYLRHLLRIVSFFCHMLPVPSSFMRESALWSVPAKISSDVMAKPVATPAEQMSERL